VKDVLIVNAGSSSLKWSVLDADSGSVTAQGDESWPPGSGAHGAALAAVLPHLPHVDAIGHRVVHGGETFHEAVLIDQQVYRAIETLSDLAPLHNPAALAGIDAAAAAFPGVPQVAAFDTAFHHSMPEAAWRYPLPRAWTARYGLRRFGFHGLSVSYAVRRCRELLGDLPERLVVCHLGAGCSVTAVHAGASIDTSMGFTPLEGLMMATRAGTVDPGLLLYLLLERGIDPHELDDALNHRSGLLGVSGVSADLRAVLAAAAAGDTAARAAYLVFMHRLVAVTGSMAAVAGGLDTLVFTGGIGEHSAPVRADLAAALAFLGVRLDPAANEGRHGDMDIALPSSPVRVFVITAREDLAILTEMRRLLP
jgi:acetate kinase